MLSVIIPLDPLVLALLVQLGKSSPIVGKRAAPLALQEVTPQILQTLRVRPSLLAITKKMQALEAIPLALPALSALLARCIHKHVSQESMRRLGPPLAPRVLRVNLA